MRTAWILPVALHSILAFAAPAARPEEELDDVPVYGNIKLTYVTPTPSPISLNLAGLEERDVAAETGSCLTKPSNVHTKSRTRARSHIRTCGESGGTCVASSTGVSSKLSVPSSSGASGSSGVLSSKIRSSKATQSPKTSSAPITSSTDYTTTVITTIYETTCPGTSTVTYGGKTYPVEYPSSTLVTETYTTVIPVSSVVAASSQVVPVTYTSESTYYETKTIIKTVIVPCSGTKTITTDATTKTSVFPSSSTVTTTETSKVPHVVTITVTESSTKAAPASSSTSCTNDFGVVPPYDFLSSTKAVPASSTTSCTNDFGVVPPYDFLSSTKAVVSSYVPVTYTTESTYYVTSTIVKTVTVPCSGTKTITTDSTTKTSVFPSSSVETKTITTQVPVTSTVTITSSSAVVPSTKAVETSSAETTSYKTTIYTTVYTTTCPGTTTITSYGRTITKTYESSTVTTETITKTVPVTDVVKTSSKARHHSHSHHGHGTGSSGFLTSYPSSSSVSAKVSSKSGSSSGFASSSKASSSAASSSAVSSKASSSVASSSAVSSKASSSVASSSAVSSKASSSVVSSSAVSSKVSSSAVSSKVSSSAVSSKVSVSASVSSKASSAVASKSASSSKTSSACSTPTPDPKCIPCEGQPGSDPKNWCGLTINDNNYKVIPKTCRTVVYDFDITNTTIAPDGIERIALLVNGEMPGPTIEANWGDTIIVNVHNKLQNNGTSIHFHGARQNHTNEMDGATSVTQCPIAPGESYTYKFVASNYGHSWYHSHFALQAYNGVFGPMVIHGPHSGEYDVDAGVLSLQDWSHDTVDMQFDAAQTVGPFPAHGPRTMDLGLINGVNTFGSSGERYVLDTEFESGKSYLLRLINVANQATFKFYIDGHSLEVISADYVPIKPYKTNIVNINPGQRYEVIVKADQAPGSYWIRSDSQDTCSAMTNAKDVKAIVNYKGFESTPTSTAYTYTQECVDEPYASLVPIVPIDAGAKDKSISKTVLVGPGPQTPNLYKWTLDGSTFVSRWSDPSLWELAENGTIPNYAGSLQVRYPKLGEWVYMVIQSPIPLPHPIHFHGHDFLVVGSGLGFYTGQPLNLKAPARRDTALMPASANSGGYLVIAWEVDNPGSWLLHCHIGFHAAMGFTMEIIEGELPDISSTLTNTCQLDKTCKAWNKYASAANILDTGV